LLCVYVHSAWKGHPEMTYTVSGGTLNSTHSLKKSFQFSYVAMYVPCSVLHVHLLGSIQSSQMLVLLWQM